MECNRRSGSSPLCLAIVFSLVWCFAPRGVSFVSAPVSRGHEGVPTRRDVFVSAFTIPAVAGLGAPAVLAEDAASLRIVRPQFSFELPGPGFQDVTKEYADPKSGVLIYGKKDGTLISVGPLPAPNFVKQERREIVPGSGSKVLNYKLSPEQDDLEYRTLPMMTDMGEAVHKWFRVLRPGAGKGAYLMIVELPEVQVKTEAEKMQAAINSFRLGA